MKPSTKDPLDKALDRMEWLARSTIPSEDAAWRSVEQDVAVALIDARALPARSEVWLHKDRMRGVLEVRVIASGRLQLLEVSLATGVIDPALMRRFIEQMASNLTREVG